MEKQFMNISCTYKRNKLYLSAVLSAECLYKKYRKKEMKIKFLDLKECSYFIEKGNSSQELALAYVRLISAVIVKF